MVRVTAGTEARRVETLCVHREWRIARLAHPRPFVSHEYLNWILKAQNHRTNEPLPRDLGESGTSASNFEADLRAS